MFASKALILPLGWNPGIVDAQPCPRVRLETKTEVANSDNHSSLYESGINYGCGKVFKVKAPGVDLLLK
jgi:hypothetical protein